MRRAAIHDSSRSSRKSPNAALIRYSLSSLGGLDATQMNPGTQESGKRNQSFRLCHMEASKSINESESLFQETVEASRGSLPSFAANCNSFILSRRDSA